MSSEQPSIQLDGEAGPESLSDSAPLQEDPSAPAAGEEMHIDNTVVTDTGSMGRGREEGKQELVCWWKRSSQQDIVNFSLLYSVKGNEFTVQLVESKGKKWPFLTRELEYAMVEEATGTQIWTATFSREFFARKPPYLSLEVKKTLWFNDKNESKQPLSLPGSFNHYFLFKDMLQKREVRFPTPHKCLLHYAAAVLQQSSYWQVLPELIEQLPSIDSSQPEETQAIYSLCEQSIRQNRTDMKLAGCLLALIGVLRPIAAGDCMSEYPELLRLVDSAFLEQLNACEYEKFGKAVREGLGKCIGWSQQLGGMQWKPVLVLLSSQSATFETCLSALFTNLSITRPDLLRDWVELLEPLIPEQQTLIIPRLIGCVKDYTTLFTFVAGLHPFFSSNMRNILENVRRALANISRDKQMSEAEVLAVFNILQTAPETAKDLFYSCGFPELLAQFLRIPSASKLPLYRRFLVTEFDDRLMRKISRRDILEKLVQERNVGLATVIEQFNLQESEVISLFHVWISNHLCNAGYNYSPEDHFLRAVDRELSRIADAKTQRSIMSCAVDFTLKGLADRRESLLSIAQSVDLLTNIDLRDWLLSEYKSRSGAKPSNVSFEELIKQRTKHPDSWTIDALLSYIMGCTSPPQYAEVESKLLNSEEIDLTWTCYIGHFTIFRTYTAPTSVLACIEKFANAIIDRQMTINKELLIQRKSEEGRKRLCRYIKEALNVRFPHLAVMFKSELKTTFEEIQSIEDNLALFDDFLQSLLSNLQEKAQVKSVLTACKGNYQQLSLTEFTYTPELATLLEVAKSAGSFRRSDLFKCYLQRFPEPLSLSNVAMLCAQARDLMFADLERMLSSAESLTAQIVKEAFRECESWRHEVKLIKESRPDWKDGLEQLSQCMELYESKDTIKQHCQSIDTLRPFLRISEDGLRKCRVLLACFPTLPNSPLRQVAALLQEVMRELSPSEQYSQGEAVLQLFTDLQRDVDFVRFVDALSDERLKYMLECVNDYDESTLNAQAVMQLDTVWSFWVGAKEHQTYDRTFSKVKDMLKEIKFGDIRTCVRACELNLRAFQELSTDLERREEAKRKQMEALYRHSSFSFTRSGSTFDTKASSPDIRRSLNLADLCELKDRASLSLHAAKTEEERNNARLLRSFVDLVREVQVTILSLDQLVAFGYCGDFAETREFSCVDGKFDELNEFRVAKESALLGWKSTIENIYTRYHILTYLYGAQFWEVESYLQGKGSAQAESLLSYLGKHASRVSGLSKSDPAGRLVNMAKALTELPAIQKVAYELQYRIPAKAVIEQYQGRVLYLETPSERMLHALFSLYLHTNNIIPRAAQVLFCTHVTSWPELQAFLYRCFTSPNEGELYSLVNCERLPLETQTQVRSLFHQLRSKHTCNHFGFSVLTSRSDCLLAEYFQQLEEPPSIIVRETQLITDELVLGSVIRQVDSKDTEGKNSSDTLVVLSDEAGLGKSTWIRKACKKEAVTFPIAGDLDLAEICSRLLIQLKGNISLHITLSHVDNPNLLNDLLTDLIVFRTLRAGVSVVVIPQTVKIFIEVQNLQPSLLTHLPILKHLTQQRVHFDMQRLHLDSTAVLVSRYLYLYKTNMLDTDPMTVNPSREEMISLLEEYFVRPQQGKNQSMSYLAIVAFIRIMNELIGRWNNSAFTPPVIQYMIGDLRAAGASALINDYLSLRTNIFSGLLQTAEEITTRCVTSARSSQRSAVASEVEVPNYERKLGWEQSNHFSFFFLSDYSHCTVYRDVALVPDAVKKLLFIQTNCGQRDAQALLAMVQRKEYGIEDYASMSHVQLLQKLQVYAKQTVNLAHMYKDADYVMTPDNLLKMHLINLRADFKLPIIIMGETGCGKSSLVRFFVEKVRGEKFTPLNIHAGVTSALFSALFTIVISTARQIYPMRSWVFFDEFNTSDSVGQISEILCDRRYYGEIIPDNMVVVAACNPYRVKPKTFADDNVGIKKAKKYKNRMHQNLMHLVKPLPETCLEYIWDFGALTAKDAFKYVQTMVKRKLPAAIVDLFVSVICASQQYFQEKEDVSSVSLRDVARFVFLYEWLHQSLQARQAYHEDHRLRERAEKYGLTANLADCPDLSMMGAVLALCSCYYYRLARQEQRNEYLHLVETASSGRVPPALVRKMLTANEDDFLARMDLPDGVALNQAFRENISCIINCVFAKVALFICGKPGCSKSLAIQVVLANFRGEKSQDAYFRTLQELVLVPFQGSESCTSEGILKVFDRAKRFLKGNLNILPVVIFDEIGLAEISKHNPLKVLHSLLELENREIAFVGISNWRLDASKMNRAMYLARPDPGVEELKLTALALYRTIRKQPIQTHTEILSSLAFTYHQYKDFVKTQSNEDADFFGLRDFYHLVKQTAVELSRDEVHNPHQQVAIVKRAIERNFGGKPDAVAKLHSFFSCIQHVETIYNGIAETPTTELIRQNLDTPGARYLMLICSGEVAAYAVDKCLQHKERRVLVGSRMPGDEEGQEYSIKLLSDIILYMEKGISLVLKDLDYIYSSLYDLFNQNFAVAGGRKYCRVALGAQFNPRCFVHDDFHVIVFLSDDGNRLEQTDAPFLNRFEKHRFEVDQLLNGQQRAAFKETREWIEELMQLHSGRQVQLQLSHIFPLFSEEYLKLMILFQDPGTQDLATMVHHCKEELLYTATEELLLVIHASTIKSEDKEQVRAKWQQLHTQSFPAYLQVFQAKSKYDLTVVFTYDSGILQVESLPVSVLCQHFSSFRREQDLLDSLTQFYSSDEQVYVLDFHLARHSQHLPMVKFTIERICREHKPSRKKMCLLIRLARNVEFNTEVCWFGDWDKRSFCTLHNANASYTQEFLSMNITDLMCNEVCKFEEEIVRITLEAFQKMNLQPGPLLPPDTVNEHIAMICEGVGQNPTLIEKLKTKILALMAVQKPPDWVEEVLCNRACVKRAPNLLAALRSTVETEILKHYPKVIFAIEKHFAFRSFFTETTAAALLQRLWLAQVTALKCDYALHAARNSNVLELSLLLDFPFSYKDFKMIESLYKEYENNREEENAKYQFLRQYRDRTVLQSVYPEICAESDLVEFYLRDLARLSLDGRPGFHKYEGLAWQIIRFLSAEDSSVESKVFSIFDNRHFALALLEVLRLLENIDRVVFAEVQQLIEALATSVITEPSQDDLSPQQVQQMHVASVISIGIKLILNSVEQVQAASDLGCLAAALHTLMQVCQVLSRMYAVELEHLAELQIWANIADVLSQSRGGSQLLSRIKALAAEKSVDEYLFDLQFAQSLVLFLEANCVQEATQRFKSVYYVNLFLRDRSCLQLIVDEINKPESLFWRFSPTLIGLIVESMLEAVADYPFFSESEDLEALETVLQQAGLESRFSVLCSDFIARNMSEGTDEELLVTGWDNLQRCHEKDTSAYPLLTKLHSSAYIRRYLEAYCRLLVADSLMSVEETAVMKAVDRWLFDRVHPSALVYAAKYIKQSKNWSVQRLNEWKHTRPAVTWPSHFDFSSSSNLVPPETTASALRVYNQTTSALEAFKKQMAEATLEPVVTLLKNGDDCAGFAIAILHRRAEGRNEQLFKHLTSLKELESRLGSALYQFVILLVSDPLTSSPLGDTDGTSLCLCLIQLLAKESVFRSVYVNAKGQVHANLPQRLGPLYVYGVGVQPLYDSLAESKDNFATLKNPKVTYPVKGRANKCSCGFVYFVQGCGGPMFRLPCPFCTQSIGGDNHVFVAREGHCNLSDQEAWDYLISKVEQYKNSQERGIRTFPCGLHGSPSYREIQVLSHHMLRLFLFLQLHFLHIAHLLSETAIRELLNPSDSSFLISAIKEDYRAIKAALSTVDAHIWWVALISKLRIFIEQHKAAVSTLQERTAFEKDFDQIVTPFFASPVSIIHNEKQRVESKPDIAIIEEVARPSDCPDISLFRVTTEPTLDELRNSFERQNLQQHYPLIQLYLQMAAELVRLQALTPLLELSNYLLQLLSHRIRRDEAASKHLFDLLKTDPELKERYQKAEDAWNQHLTVPLQIDCHLLEPLELKSSLELGYFLPDKLQQGGGLYIAAALKTLAETQNRALSGFQDFLTKQTGQEASYLLDLRQYPIQSLRPEQIIEEVDWSTCYVNNWEYGKGSEVIFNFEKLQGLIRLSFAQGKYVSADNIKLMQYQFEMLCSSADNSDLISAIRTAVHQEQLTAEEAKRIQQSWVAQRDETNEERVQELLQVYEGLERLLCFLKNSVVSPETSICAFAATHEHFGLHQQLVQPTTLSQLPLKCIVGLYELLEVELFPYVKTFVRAEYKEKSEDTILKLRELDWTRLPEVERLQLALLRLIVRLLVCGGLDPAQVLGLYIVRQDFWEASCSEALVGELAEQLADIPLAHAVQVYELLENQLQKLTIKKKQAVPLQKHGQKALGQKMTNSAKQSVG